MIFFKKRPFLICSHIPESSISSKREWASKDTKMFTVISIEMYEARVLSKKNTRKVRFSFADNSINL